MASTIVKRSRARERRTLLIGLAIIVALFAFNWRHPDAFQIAELKASDMRMYVGRAPSPTGAIAIAAIDDASIAALGHWPWSRSVEARLVDALASYKPAVIGFDVLFSEADADDVEIAKLKDRLALMGLSRLVIDQALTAGNDSGFAQSLKAQGATYLGYAFESHRLGRGLVGESNAGFRSVTLNPPPLDYQSVREVGGKAGPLMSARAYLPPVPILNSAARGTAFVDVDADADGTMRTEMTVVRFNRRYCVPLYLALAAAYRNGATTELELAPFGVASVWLGDTHIPVDELGRMIIRFRGPAGTFPRYSISDILAHRVPPAALAGKIVLVGVTAHALGDRVVTPVGADFPGVELHANALDNLLRGDFVSRSEAGTGEERLAAFALVLAVSLAAAYLSAMWSAATAFALIIGFSAYAQYRLDADGVLIGVVFPLAAAVVAYTGLASYRYITEGLEKRHLRNAFEHYLHPDVIASVVDDPEGLKLGGERRHLAILFSDIVNFTARAERSEPEPLVALLNTYMSVMTELVLESDGVVDKLMGDGIMAFWGAPAHIEHPAQAAVDCALRMLDGLAELRRSDPRFADFDIGIGIATGEAVVGNFGGAQRFDYSVIGDTVNLAARLEGLTRHFKVHILVNRQTLDEAGAGYCAREIGLVRVKGKAQLVSIAEVAARRSDDANTSFYDRFNEALERIRNGAPEDARTTLDSLRAIAPDDRPLNLYLERLNGVADRTPAEIVFEFETK